MQPSKINLWRFERRLKTVEAQLKQIKAKLKKDDIHEEQYKVEEIGRKYLRLIAREGRTGILEAFAACRGARKIVAEYHANKLVSLGLIELTGYNPAGTLYVLRTQAQHTWLKTT